MPPIFSKTSSSSPLFSSDGGGVVWGRVGCRVFPQRGGPILSDTGPVIRLFVRFRADVSKNC